MRAGTLRSRITLMQPQTVASDWGNTISYVSAGDVWASVLPTKAAEAVADQGVQLKTSYTIRTRYRDDISSDWQIVYNGKTFDIAGIVNVGNRNKELEITATEHV